MAPLVEVIVEALVLLSSNIPAPARFGGAEGAGVEGGTQCQAQSDKVRVPKFYFSITYLSEHIHGVLLRSSFFTY